jgi:sn-glycerol 3-phosphate transport system substrate-binding protein
MRTLHRAAVLALSALCALSAAVPAAASERIRFWHAMSGALGVQLDALVARFNAAQKDVVVEAAYKGDYDSLMQAVLAPPADGAAPNIVQIYDVGTAQMMARRGLVRPVWQVLAEAGEALRAEFVPAVASYFSDPSGRLVALPFNSSTPVLYYNKAHFRRARLDPDKPPRTWYEMPAALGELRDSGSECPYASSWPSWVHLENMSAWHNQEFATRGNGYGGLDARLAFNTQLMVRHIAMLSSWAKSRYYVPTGREDEAERRFLRGECSVLTASSASYAAIAAQPGLEFGIARLPYYDDWSGAPYNTLVGGAGLWVLAATSRAEQRGVARFLAFLARPEVQAEWHQKTGYVPVSRDAYNMTAKRGFYQSHPGYEVAILQLAPKGASHSRGIRLGAFDRIRTIIDEELEAVWTEKKTPKDALDSAVERGNLLLREFERAHGPGAPERPASRSAGRRAPGGDAAK